MEFERVLAIETSVEMCSVAVLGGGGEVLWEEEFVGGRQPSSALWEPLGRAREFFSGLGVVVVG
ncbi:MAG: hypothetical protein AAGC74_13965, partial [Verrucomicrobiota bacterium]